LVLRLCVGSSASDRFSSKLELLKGAGVIRPFCFSKPVGIEPSSKRADTQRGRKHSYLRDYQSYQGFGHGLATGYATLSAILLCAVRKHTDCPWVRLVLLYKKQWFKAPVQVETALWKSGRKGRRITGKG